MDNIDRRGDIRQYALNGKRYGFIFIVDTRSISAEAVFEPSVIIFSNCIGGDLTIYDQIIADVWNHISRIDRLKGIIESTLAECEERHKNLSGIYAASPG